MGRGRTPAGSSGTRGRDSRPGTRAAADAKRAREAERRLEAALADAATAKEAAKLLGYDAEQTKHFEAGARAAQSRAGRRSIDAVEKAEDAYERKHGAKAQDIWSDGWSWSATFK